MSTFVSDLTHDLSLRIVAPGNVLPSTPKTQEGQTKETLRALFLSLNQPNSLSTARGCLGTVQSLETGSWGDEEEEALRRAVLGKLAVDLYGKALDTFLEEAREVEDELEWWADVERSTGSVSLYLLQTLPARIFNVSHTIVTTLRKRNLPLRPSFFTPASLRQLFPSHGVLRPNTLTIALFPHLHAQPYSIALSVGRLPSPFAFATSPRKSFESVFTAFASSLASLARGAVAVVMLPLELTRGECRYKYQELRRLRDERAETLGTLADMRNLLASALEEKVPEQGTAKLADFASTLQCVIRGESPAQGSPAERLSTVQALQGVAADLLPAEAGPARVSEMRVRDLARPSRLTLLWPRLVLLPPLAVYAVRSAYASRASIHQMASEALETIRGFWEGWLLDPLRDVAKTVRAGGDDGVIVNRESVKADLDSLERMTLALVKEKLHYDAAQMESLSRQIQVGDLTPVMQIYEEDIKSPFRSAISGTLLRTLFIQVQKTKVDIDQALTGIDKLLKSQELTFEFVGVAPALAIVYALVGYLRSIWTGGRGRGRYGGKKRRTSVWLKMRRIERLLIAQPTSHPRHTRGSSELVAPSIPPLTSGLLLLSVSHLRTYAERYLPVRSRLREGFLEDVVDLEDPALGRAEKLRVLDRMWRSWKDALGWGNVAGNMAN